MKLLLDENLPRKLKHDFPNHEVYTVGDMHWDGLENGDLLAALLASKPRLPEIRIFLTNKIFNVIQFRFWF